MTQVPRFLLDLLRSLARGLRTCLPIFVSVSLAFFTPVQAHAIRCESVMLWRPGPRPLPEPSPEGLGKLNEMRKGLLFKLRTISLHNDPGLGWLSRLYNGPVRLLSILPLPQRTTEVGEVFQRVWQNPQAALTKTDMEILSQYQVLELAQAQKKFLDNHPYYRGIRIGLNQTRILLSLVLLLLAIDQTVDSAMNTYEEPEYVRLPNYDKDGVPLIHLLIETMPFPHTALRIGPQVYSYGVDHMSSRSTAEYFARIPQDLRPEAVNSSSWNWTNTSVNWSWPKMKPWADPVIQRMKDSGILERSVRYVEIKLPKDQAIALRQELEMNTAKRYNNISTVNDCATMISRVLEKHSGIKTPPIVDAFPTTAAMYLTGRRLAGDTRIGHTGLILQNRAEATKHLARNFWIAKLEAMAFVTSAVYSVPQRLALNAEDGALQWWDPKFLEEIEGWKTQTRQALKDDYDYDELVEMKKRADPEKFARMVHGLFAPARRQAVQVIQSYRTEFNAIIVAQTKIEEIDRMLAELAPPPKKDEN